VSVALKGLYDMAARLQTAAAPLAAAFDTYVASFELYNLLQLRNKQVIPGATLRRARCLRIC
jgi:hypothetical protein